MKRTSTTLIFCTILCAGCANFKTTQVDESTNPTNGTIRKITTRASATTFFSSKSDLANFKAAQTDKTQSASVGALKQESTEPVDTLQLLGKAIDKIPTMSPVGK